MQGLSIQDPQVIHIQAHQHHSDPAKEKDSDAAYNILMKLAVTGGQPRALSLSQRSSAVYGQSMEGELSGYISTFKVHICGTLSVLAICYVRVH